MRDPWYLAPEGKTHSPGLTPETGLDDAIVRFARRTGRMAVQRGGDVAFEDRNRRRPH